MKQALHIFKKDVHYLWREIAMFMLISATLGWAETHTLDTWWVETLVVIAAVYVIARVIHADVIAGYNQFWITRPYRWQSLLGAKLLFLMLLSLPILLAQWFIANASGFSFVSILPGLIWSQVLIAFCLSLPIAAVACLTAGLGPFLLIAFLLLAAGFISTSDMIGIWNIHVPLHDSPNVPQAVDWIRKSLGIALLVLLSICILLLQYRRRRTQFSRRLAIAVGTAVALTYIFLPWFVSLEIQSRLFAGTFDDRTLQITLGPNLKGSFPLDGREQMHQVPVSFPILVSGIPPGFELESDAMSITLKGRRASACRPSFNGVNHRPSGERSRLLFVYCLMDPQFFREENQSTIALKAEAYFTVFADERSATIPVQRALSNVPGNLRCGSGLMNQLHCSSAFRWPRRRVYAKFGEGGNEAFASAISYSPFPAELALNPIETHWVSTSDAAAEATITTKRPVSHFRHDFEISGIRLADLTKNSRR